MTRFFLFCISVFFFLSSSIIAQRNRVDSLKLIIEQEKNDSVTVNCLNDLGTVYLVKDSYDSAHIYFLRALEISIRISYKKGRVFSLGQIGNVLYYGKFDLPKALSYYNEILRIADPVMDKREIARCYNNMGNLLMDQSNYSRSLEYYLKALKIREQLNDSIGMGNCFSNIGVVYNYNSDYSKAREYFQKSLEINEKYKDSAAIGSDLLNLGVVFKNTGKSEEALSYYFKALQIKQQEGDPSTIAICCNNIGVIYDEQKNYSKALEYYELGLKTAQKADDTFNTGIFYLNIGNLYFHTRKYALAKHFLSKAIELKTSLGDLDGLSKCFESLALVYQETGDYKMALENYVQFKKINDSVFNTENSARLSDIKTNYEVEKKENEFKAEQEKREAVFSAEQAKKELELTNQKLVRNGIAIGAACLLLLVFFVIRNLNQIKRTNKLIAEQKAEVEVKNHLIEEKQREILDSITYAKRLQDAILPAEGFVSNLIPENFILYKPKDIVAGDFYWMEYLDDKIFVAVADSTGHGVPGAMVSVVCSNALNRAVKEFGLRETGRILDKTRDLVLETFEKSSNDVKDGMDISFLAIDKRQRKAMWSGANNPLWYIQNGELKEIKADKQPIGKTFNTSLFTTHTIAIAHSTIFYLFTDGFADQFGGPRGKKYKYKQLADLILSNHTLSLETQKKLLENSLSEWKGSMEQVDDVCVMGLLI